MIKSGFKRGMNKESLARFARSGRGKVIIAATATALLINHLIKRKMIKKNDKKSFISGSVGRNSLSKLKNETGRWIKSKGKSIFIRRK